ncbi:hypothetical protein GCM10009609_35440 [Pseudonocardia aurantiaca]|uniref:hypothetical protein n=1 Tax=Pseudonocardia aurantiaca TaxID=75290 RepID=UPI0031D98C4E
MVTEAPDGDGPPPGADVHALLDQGFADLGAHEVLLARQQPPSTHDEGEARPERPVCVYTTAGGVFFVLQAVSLAWRQRRRTVQV